MKILRLFPLLGLLLAPAAAEPLTEPERQALLDQLEALENAAQNSKDARIRAAAGAFRSALESPQSAIEFYEKCVEKVDYIDRGRDSQDYREWKRRNRERLGDNDFGKALQLQMRWLILAVQAGSDNPPDDIIPRAHSLLLGVFDDAKALQPHQRVLSSNVFGTPFAKAYELDDLKPQEWPSSILPAENIYEQVILPPLRLARDYAGIRATWTERINCELAVIEQLTPPNRRNGEDDDDAHEEAIEEAKADFISEKRPELIWEMEVDVYKAGDEQQAALRMLSHIKAHLTHEKVGEWQSELRGLVDPESAEADPAGNKAVAEQNGDEDAG